MYTYLFKTIFFYQASKPKSCMPLSPIPFVAHFSLHFVVHLIARLMFGEKHNYESPPSAVYCTLFTSPRLRLKFLFQYSVLDNLSLYSLINMEGQDSHPYKTTGRIVISYISIVTLLDGI